MASTTNEKNKNLMNSYLDSFKLLPFSK